MILFDFEKFKYLLIYLNKAGSDEYAPMRDLWIRGGEGFLLGKSLFWFK